LIEEVVMSEIEKEAREYCLNLILNTVLSDEYVFDPQTSHSVKFIHPRSLELANPVPIWELTKDLYPNLLCQDMEKKLAVWFESRLDAREVFRRNLLSDSKKGKK
jgi:hypothetical protein